MNLDITFETNRNVICQSSYITLEYIKTYNYLSFCVRQHDRLLSQISAYMLYDSNKKCTNVGNKNSVLYITF